MPAKSQSSIRISHKRRNRTRSLPPPNANKSDSNLPDAQPERQAVHPPIVLKDFNAGIDPKNISLPPLELASTFLGIQERLSPDSGSRLPIELEGNDPVPFRDSTRDPSSFQDRDCGKSQTEKEIAKDDSEKTSDKVHHPDGTGWARLYDLVSRYDRGRVTDTKEDIDTLLVFAGLFSAVVTAFIVESYKNLQQQPEDLTNHILMQLTLQISHFSIHGNLINSTVPDFVTPPFRKSRVVVIINTLWVLSLLITLIVASAGILVKEWFHELLSYETHDPKERLKLRFFREAGIERWKVFAVASSLPLLLQLALPLFFIGLVSFLHNLDAIVAWFATGTVILWFTSFLFTILAPTVSSQCPYKIPFLKDVISRLRVKLMSFSWLTDVARRPANRTSQEGLSRLDSWSSKLYNSFETVHREWESFEERSLCKDSVLDLPVIALVWNLLQGEKLHDSILECIRDISPQDMEDASKHISKPRSSAVRDMLPNSSPHFTNVVGSFALAADQDKNLQSMYSRDTNVQLYAPLYFGLVHLLSRAHIPPQNWLIPSHFLPAFIHLIEENPISAALASLTCIQFDTEFS